MLTRESRPTLINEHMTMMQKHRRKVLSAKSLAPYRSKLSRKSTGFTLVELIVTVAILSFGIVAIYEALFVSVDAFGYYTNYLNTQDWISEKISETEDGLTQSQTLEIGQTSGQITRNYKTFDWIMIVDQKSEEQGLYQVNVTLSWREGSKTIKTSRTAYLLSPHLKLYEENEEGSV